MRYAIFGDVHSNIEALEAVINAYQSEAIDKYLCLGDVVGYAANPNECVEKISRLAMLTVAGNHDWAAVDLFSLDYFNPLVKEAVLWTRQNLDDRGRDFLEKLKLTYSNEDLTLTHGTLDNPQEFHYMTDGYIAEESFRRQETQVCFIGHTHTPGIFSKDKDDIVRYSTDDSVILKPGNKYIVNVGSVGQPRDGNPKASYCIYDTEKEEVRIKRAGYDTETTRKKILAVGLPAFLGDRLLMGK